MLIAAALPITASPALQMGGLEGFKYRFVRFRLKG